MRILFVLLLLVLLPIRGALALDVVRVQPEKGAAVTLEGKILITARDGGLLLQTPDGAMHPLQPHEILEKRHDERPFEPLSSEKLAAALLKDLPAGFETYRTKHYVIAYNTSREYATWCGGLLERLRTAFINVWTRKGLKLHAEEFPLPVVIFASQKEYAAFAEAELGKVAGAVVGFYSMQSNRILTYDLTEMKALGGMSRRGSPAEINAMLDRPEAENAVATVVHEATHQIAFNSGLQTRFADIPAWLSEGLAVYFEAPDLRSAKGWKGVGNVNHNRLDQFLEYLPQRPDDSLRSLITDDKRFRDPKVALRAYAEAWALCYYLIQRHPEKFAQYLHTLSEKPQMFWDDEATRLKDFRAAFGSDLPKLDSEFLRYIERLR